MNRRLQLAALSGGWFKLGISNRNSIKIMVSASKIHHTTHTHMSKMKSQQTRCPQLIQPFVFHESGCGLMLAVLLFYFVFLLVLFPHFSVRFGNITLTPLAAFWLRPSPASSIPMSTAIICYWGTVQMDHVCVTLSAEAKEIAIRN